MGARRGNARDHGCSRGDGALLRIGEVAAERRRAQTNADVWSAEGQLNALFGQDSPICSECWMAYLAPIGKWCRSLAEPEHFKAPLAAAVRKFPVPRTALSSSTLVYNQLYGDGLYTESVGYWCERDEKFTAQLEDYARQHGLALDLEPGPPDRHGQVLVSATSTRRR